MLADQDLISKDRIRLQNPYAHEDDEGGFSALLPEHVWRGGNPYATLNNQDDSDEMWPSIDISSQPAAPASLAPPVFMHPEQRGHQNPYGLVQSPDDEETVTPLPPILSFGDLLKNGRLTNDKIEIAARQLAHSIYRARHSLFPEGIPDDPIELLDPKVAFHLLGYQFLELDTMGEIEPGIDVAGIIDQDNMRVSISRRFTPLIRNFTAAHELGHVLLHRQSGLHRDKPIDSGGGGQRDMIERQADFFAACFLMPKKLLEERFHQRFADVLSSRENLAFLLNRSGDTKVDKELSTKRGLARALASLSSINGHAVMSLAEQFKVSVEAMAIRLEQLDLVPEY
jgi:Zn-dependent peptidase ImmA (M78 family)